MVQTIDSEKLALAVNNAWEKNRAESEGKLKVLIQVNTSAEDEKNGVEPAKVPELFTFINDKCKALDLQGLMTIGAYGFDYSKGPNPDFIALLECLEHIPRPESLELSFGMSDDFEKAVSAPDGCVGNSVWCFKRFDEIINIFTTLSRSRWAAQSCALAARFSDSEPRRTESDWKI